MSNRASILLLADDTSAQKAIRESLETAEPAAEIEILASDAAALARLSEKNFDCVFCCLSEGADGGVNFLAEAWNQRPSCDRFVVAPAIDQETQVRCAFGAHHYLPLPLESKLLSAALDGAQARKVILPNETVQKLIARMRSLPSKPSIYFEVMREIRSETGTPETIAKLIKKDMGIAAKLIQVVNSLFYGRAEATADIHEAVLFLGFEVTASIVLSLEAISRFQQSKPLHDLADRIWTHSQALAELSRRICQGLGQTRHVCEEVYLAGLLHDIGKLALAQNFPTEYQEISRHTSVDEDSRINLEKERLGVTHAEAGAYLLAVWGLPMHVVETVAFHHASGETLAAPFKAAMPLRLAEQFMESARPLDEILADYPENCGLQKRFETLSSLLSDRSADRPKLPRAISASRGERCPT